MRAQHITRSFRGKAIDPTTLTCPNCGHRARLFERERRVVPKKPAHRLLARRTNLIKSTEEASVRTRIVPALLAVRGGLLWFSIVLLTVGAFSGLLRQSILPGLVGAGLLAVYGLTSLALRRARSGRRSQKRRAMG